MSMKRIALFVPGGLGDIHSGIHIPTLYDLVARLSERHEMVAYSQRLPNKHKSTAYCGKAKVRFLDVSYHSNAVTRSVVFLKAFWSDHRLKNFDLLHGMWGIPFGLYAVLSGKIWHIPSVVSLLGQDTASIPSIGYGALRKQPQRSLTHWLWHNATALIAQSEFQVDRMRAFGFRRSDVRIIPHGVDTTLFNSRKNGKSRKQVRFISIGDKNRVKDQSTLLKAFARVIATVDSRIRLIGEDHFQGELRSLAHQLGISDKVEFYDFVPHSEIPQHLSWADVFLQSSLSEGGGAAVLEAAASNVAICGTRVGFLADLEKRQMAVGVDLHDYETLARRVIELLKQPERITAMRRGALEWVRNHDINWTAETMTDLYEKMISNYEKSTIL